MSDQTYQPEHIEIPPVFAWPPRPKEALRYLTVDIMVPWGLFWIATAFVFWRVLTPEMHEMRSFSFGWVAFLWVRNALVLTVIAGGLHWWLYVRKSQNTETKFSRRWLAQGNARFLWGDQVHDNMTFSLVSGVTVWTLYEAATYWWYANGYVSAPAIADGPFYFLITLWAVFFWSTLHFYLNHRLLHTRWLYKVAHERHHLNVVTGPWSGISMHPIEHIIYFTVFLLWWVVPVHPVIIILTGLFQGVSPAVSHSGFDYVRFGGKWRIPAGDNFHNLHHRFFRVNYGNSLMPIDRVFDSWNGGSEEDMQRMKERFGRESGES